MSCPHTHLTVLTPIDPATPLTDLTDYFDGDKWQEISEKVFQYCDMLHMCRFQVIDHLVPSMGDSEDDPLKSKYLLFSAQIDHDSAAFYEAIYREKTDNGGAVLYPEGVLARQIWGKCRDFPELNLNLETFKAYMSRFEIDPHIEYEGVNACLPEILKALVAQRLWGIFFEVFQASADDLDKQKQVWTTTKLMLPLLEDGEVSLLIKAMQGLNVEKSALEIFDDLPDPNSSHGISLT